MAYEGENPNFILSSAGGKMNINTGGRPDWRWFLRWVLFTTAAIPLAFVIATPLAAIGLAIQKLASNSGLINQDSNSYLTLFGFLAAFALTQGVAQWLMLRSYLPRPKNWFIATAVGLFLGGSIFGGLLIMLTTSGVMSAWLWSITVIPVGLGLGLSQWLVLRRIVPNALWIILVDGLAVGSSLLSGESITSLPELVIILLLPGMITGAGVWLLLRRSVPIPTVSVADSSGLKLRVPRFIRIGLGLIALVPLFFGCSWAYATSQLELAKNEGVYATPEEAVIAKNSQGWGGASVIKLDNVRAEPNNSSGKQPHIWFGFAEVYLDKVPEGFDRKQYSSGSFYVHVRDGWVFMGEGAFPEFVGWVMEVFNLEGTRDWIHTR
jgi:hypothetical protein